MSNIKYLVLFLIGIFLLFLCSCTAEQQLARIHKKRPDLFQKDTIRIHDTTYIAASKADTIFRQSKVTDTVTVNNSRLTMKYYYSNDTVFLSGTCRDTTIIKEILVPTEKAIITEGKTPAWKNYLLIAGWILVAVLFLLALIRR